jgi:hypothetical protein
MYDPLQPPGLEKLGADIAPTETASRAFVLASQMVTHKKYLFYCLHCIGLPAVCCRGCGMQ